MKSQAKLFSCLSFSILLALKVQAILPAVALQGSQTVTLDAPGWSLEKICEAISNQIGQKVAALGDCVTDHLIVKVHDVPWSVLQQKLAWTEYGHWVRLDNVLTLERDPKRVRAALQLNTNHFAEVMTTEIKKARLIAAPPFNAKQFVEEFKNPGKGFSISDHPASKDTKYPLSTLFFAKRNKFPFPALIKSIVASLPIQSLVHIPFDSRIVFSNHPTSLQLPMPNSTVELIQTAIAENDQLAKAFEDAGIDLSGYRAAGSFADVTPNDQITISVRNSLTPSIDFQFRAFNSSGHQIMCYSSYLMSPEVLTRAHTVSGPITECRLSQQATQLYLKMESAAILPPSQSLLKKVRNPLQTDPLALLVSPTLDAIAPNANIVAGSDWLLLLQRSLYRRNQRALIASNSLSSGLLPGFTEINSKDNWLCIRTRLQSLRSVQAIPRQAYAKFVRTIHPNGLFEFVPSMKYANSLGEDGYLKLGLVSNSLRALGHGQNPLDQQDLGWNLFRLAGSLTKAELARVESKKGLEISRLRSSSKKILKTILLRKFMGPLESTELHPEPSAPEFETINLEPTFAFAKDPPMGIFRIMVNKWPKISFSVTESGSNYALPVTRNPSEVASWMEAAKYETGSKFDFSHMRVFTDVFYSVYIYFPTTNLPTIRAEFETYRYNSKTYNGLKSLPAAIRNQVESELKKIKGTRPNVLPFEQFPR